MIRRIHILGASGSGTITLGRALAARLQYPHFDGSVRCRVLFSALRGSTAARSTSLC
jgi:cytidylate kinase